MVSQLSVLFFLEMQNGLTPLTVIESVCSVLFGISKASESVPHELLLLPRPS